jgi:hypothetical protein
VPADITAASPAGCKRHPARAIIDVIPHGRRIDVIPHERRIDVIPQERRIDVIPQERSECRDLAMTKGRPPDLGDRPSFIIGNAPAYGVW